jgi:phosphoglycerate kinase
MSTTNLNLESITNSTVLVRVCYDLPDLQSFDRILDSQKTISLLLKQNNKVILATHWDRPEGKNLEFSLLKQKNLIEKVLAQKVEFVDQYNGFELAKKTIKDSKNQLFLLENTRFDADEKSKDAAKRSELAQKYATLASFFVDEAFPVSHRKEATNCEIKNFLPSCLGLSYQSEIANLEKLKNNPAKPFVAVMAGSKLETKLPLIEKMLPLVDKLILGGKLCFVFVKVLQDQGNSKYLQADLGLSEIEQDFYDKAAELLEKYSDKLVLPLDFVYGDKDFNIVEKNFTGKYAYDLGENSLAEFKEVLVGSKTIFWNGTLGCYEKKPFDTATLELAAAVTELPNSFKVIGGGDTNASLSKDLLAKFDFVSMGGGATLDYLAR